MTTLRPIRGSDCPEPHVPIVYYNKKLLAYLVLSWCFFLEVDFELSLASACSIRVLVLAIMVTILFHRDFRYDPAQIP